MYANRLSSVSSSSDYPSSMSTLRDSALGLTNSPRSFAEPSSPGSSRPRAHDQRSRANLRESRSSSSLLAASEPLNKHLERSNASASNTPKPKITRKPPPRRSAEDWEAELVQNAKRLHIQSPPEDLREEQRRKDAEWEQSGMWEAQLNSARQAEDRTRREAGRDIAYPPSYPRVPIRAGASGVTSVHVGLRPRLHPSLSETSIYRNQPDTSLRPPLFSPMPQAQRTPAEEELLHKAKEQYETWLSKKAEREGGIEDAFGTRDWVPRDRVVARPTLVSTATASAVPSIRIERSAPRLVHITPHPVEASETPSTASSAESEHDRATTPQDAWYDPLAHDTLYPGYDPVHYWGQFGMTPEQGMQYQQAMYAQSDPRFPDAAYDPAYET